MVPINKYMQFFLTNLCPSMPSIFCYLGNFQIDILYDQFLFQVIGCDIWHDWRWRQCWSRFDTTNLLQRIKILQRNRDYTNGNYDNMLYSSNNSNLFSTMGRHVLWTLHKETFRRGLLLVRMELQGERERLSLGKQEVRREQPERKRRESRLSHPP